MLRAETGAGISTINAVWPGQTDVQQPPAVTLYDAIWHLHMAFMVSQPWNMLLLSTKINKHGSKQAQIQSQDHKTNAAKL